MPQILKFDPLSPFTGGVQGIVILKPDPPFGLPLDADQWLYYFTLAVLLVMFCGGRESGPQPQRPRDHGDPRQPDRGGGDGHRHGAVQDR